MNWIEFDIPDIIVNPGNTYYIIIRTTGGTISNHYRLGVGFNTAYNLGRMSISFNNGNNVWYKEYPVCGNYWDDYEEQIITMDEDVTSLDEYRGVNQDSPGKD